MADAVDRVLVAPTVELTKACRAHAESFSWDATAESMLRLFGDVTVARATHAPVA